MPEATRRIAALLAFHRVGVLMKTGEATHQYPLEGLRVLDELPEQSEESYSAPTGTENTLRACNTDSVALGTTLWSAALDSAAFGAAAEETDAILFVRNAEPASDTRPPYRNPF